MPLPIIIPTVAFAFGATVGGNSLLGVFRGQETRSSNVSSAVRTVALSSVAVVAIIAVTRGFKK